MQHTARASYYSEVTLPRIRTAVHCIAGVSNCVACLLPVLFAKVGFNWRVICNVGIAINLLGFILIMTVPESSGLLSMGK